MAALEAAMTKAAADLAKAALEVSDGVSVSSLAELRHIHVSADAITTAVNSVNANVAKHEAASATTSAALKQEVVALKASVQALTDVNITQVYQWAICNSQFGEFEYYDDSRSQRKSGSLVAQILRFFIRDFGMYISGYVTNSYYNNPFTAEMRKAFHDKLIEQIYSLTGRQPYIEQKGDRWVIYPKK